MPAFELSAEVIIASASAFSVFLTTVVGAFITLRKEFQKAAAKSDEIHTLVNSQHQEVKADLADAKSEIRALKSERDGK